LQSLEAMLDKAVHLESGNKIKQYVQFTDVFLLKLQLLLQHAYDSAPFSSFNVEVAWILRA